MNRHFLPTVLAVVAAAALLVTAESAFAMSGQLHMSGAPGSAGSQGNLQVRVCAVSGKLTTATGQSFVLEKGEPVEVLDGKGAEIPPGAALPSDAPGSATAGIDLQQKEAKRIIKAAGDAKAVSKLLILKRREASLKVVKTVGLATAYTGTVTVPVRANKVHILVAAKKWQTFALTQEKMLNVKVTVTAAGKASVSIIDDAGTATPVASSGSGEGLTVRARMSGIIGDYAGRVAACVHPFTICKIVQEKFSDGLAKDKDLLRKWMCTIEHESGFVADTQQDTANKDKSCDVGLMQINSVNWFRTGECGGAKWKTSAKCKARMEELKQPSANLDEAKYLFTAAKNTLGPWYGFSKTDCKLKKSYLKPRYACPPTLAKYPATLAEWLETDPDNVL